MATAPFDAELMTQQVAAVAVPNSHAFSTVRDEKGALMIFSLGTNGVFYVFKEDADGARVMLDFGGMLKLPSGSVTAFDVTQNPVDSTLYIAVAAVAPSNKGNKDSDATDAANTNLVVMKPFSPSVIDVTQANLDLTAYIIPRTGTGATSISGIFMVSKMAQSFLFSLSY